MSSGANARKKKSLENFTNIYVQGKGLKEVRYLMRVQVCSSDAF